MDNSIDQNQWHITVDGENIPLIAKQAGFRNWRTIFNHPKNAKFRQNNPDPTIIHTGDSVWIPEIAPGPSFICKTNKVNHFVVKTPKIQLNFVFNDDEGFPYSDISYEIWINGQKYGDENRRTTEIGAVTAVVPVVTELLIVLWVAGEDSEPEIYTMYPGELDPIDTIDGVQDRLKNLGYDLSEEGEKDILGPNTVNALKAFQATHGLLINGQLDKETRDKLEDLHDFNRA